MSVFIIAELSANHNGSIEQAIATIEAAADAGADAIKLQTYTADTITLDHDGPGFVIEEGLWKGRKLYDLYKEAHTPWDWHEMLFQTARDLGLFFKSFRPYRSGPSRKSRQPHLQGRLFRNHGHPAHRIHCKQGQTSSHQHGNRDRRGH